MFLTTPKKHPGAGVTTAKKLRGKPYSGGRRRRRGGAGAAQPVAGQLRGGAPLVWEALYVPGGGAGVAAPKIAAVVPIASGRCQAVNKYAENLVQVLVFPFFFYLR